MKTLRPNDGLFEDYLPLPKSRALTKGNNQFKL